MKAWSTPFAIAAALFGLATVYSGGMALFGNPEARAAAGNAVAFVLWFNFAMGFAYLAGAALIYRRHSSAQTVAWMIGLATLAVFGAFLVAALRGTPFEWRTIGAMILRAGFWLGLALALRRTTK